MKKYAKITPTTNRSQSVRFHLNRFLVKRAKIKVISMGVTIAGYTINVPAICQLAKYGFE